MADSTERPLVARIGLLVFGSGFCALVYQMAWLRLLRLIFGSSTPATAAVLAIFMAGLGAGSLVLGPAADRKANPLAFYARLEFGIAASAAISPLLIMLVRAVYVWAGGSQELGTLFGTLVRVFLAALVLGLPTFLMGGTLPAVTRAVERTEDRGRRHLGMLYGANTIGAVLGALVTTFFSIEILGIHRSIWVASLINVLVAVLAGRLARRLAGRDPVAPASRAAADSAAAVDVSAPVRWVLVAAAVVGFAFFLMELVWYRMLAPLLGGSSYTFGLILAVALLGIGAGGLLYGMGSHRQRPTLLSFALTCTLEALFLILPFALGDRLAMAALVLRDLVGLGFTGLVLSWSIVVAAVVLPAALIAGYQFPLLVAIIGSGREQVGAQVGRIYAWNTIGAIVGSLAGGFGLIPLLSATGSWRLVTVLLVALGLATAWIGARSGRRGSLLIPTALGALALLLCATVGPTAFWRHSPIGAGRVKVTISDDNQFQDVVRRKNRILLWEADGRESSVAMQSIDGASFLISGKVDGNARNDASTQVMSGLIGAALHPDPRSALVIGLGTGSTAGWLARVSTIDSVDVVELEPDIARVARDCAVVNFDVLDNPKTHLVIGDGREILLTTPNRYDIVFSEPSNPYRAGIASLFTRDFYAAVAQRLADDGIFIQWLQAYEVDGQVIRTAVATLAAVFPSVEIWHTNPSDLMLLASNRPIEHDTERLRQVLVTEPFVTAMSRVWGVTGIDGFYAGFIASDALVRAILEQESRWINTDDRPIIEFGFARNVGRAGGVAIEDLIALAKERGENRPAGLSEKALDWTRMSDLLAARTMGVGQLPFVPAGAAPDVASRIRARQAFVRDNLGQACDRWEEQPEPPSTEIDQLMLAECLAERGDERAVPLAAHLREQKRSIEAAAVLARWAARQGQSSVAIDQAVEALNDYRSDPWPNLATMKRLLMLTVELARREPEAGHRLYEAIRQPFAVYQLNELRRATLLDLARAVDFTGLCVDALSAHGEWFPWVKSFLAERYRCLDANGSPATARALRDLEDFQSIAPLAVDTGLRRTSD